MSVYENHTDTLDAALDFSGCTANHDEFNFRQWNAARHAQYFTPVACARALCDTLTALLDTPADTLTILDPTAGNGRLLHPWKSTGAAVFGIELDDAVYTRAQRVLGGDAVRHGDILDYAPYLTDRFDADPERRGWSRDVTRRAGLYRHRPGRRPRGAGPTHGAVSNARRRRFQDLCRD